MWIKNRERIVNTDTITDISVVPLSDDEGRLVRADIVMGNGLESITMGKYATAKRAHEILDAVFMEIRGKSIVFELPED